MKKRHQQDFVKMLQETDRKYHILSSLLQQMKLSGPEQLDLSLTGCVLFCNQFLRCGIWTREKS